MSVQKPTLPKGTRDFGPDKMVRRNFIFDTIRSVFRLYGFQPLETPSLENLSVLTGKYGEEGDQLIYKILNSGNFLSGTTESDLAGDLKSLASKIADKGLRYDLTVPLARYIVTNLGDITLPFKRYQIQPVWRADRPQKGRYREFVQCDVDIIGTTSLLCEAELIQMTVQIMAGLRIDDFTVKVNSRKVLAGINQVAGIEGKQNELFVAIDKMDKIGKVGVLEELKGKGWNEVLNNLEPFFENRPSSAQLAFLGEKFKANEIGSQGLAEITGTLAYLESLDPTALTKVEFDPLLARGLSYYTGAIFEVKANAVKIGSISGGGRYDDLTGAFGLPGIPAVGISFGIDRIYDVMDELELFPSDKLASTRVLVASFDSQSEQYALKILNQLRSAGVSSELFPDPVKIKKQLAYANKKSIPFVILIGSEEMKTGKLTLKDMGTGNQQSVSIEKILEIVAEN